MGILTGSEIEEEIRGNLGGRTDLDSRLYRFINFAQDQLARYHQFDELETLVETNFTVDVGTLTLPSKPLDLRSVRLIDGSNSRKLVYYTPREFDLTVPKTDWFTSGWPSIYTTYQQCIEVWRVPDDTYVVKLRYKAYPTLFTGSGSADTVDFESCDDIIVALATSWAFRSLGESEKAGYWVGIAAKSMRYAKELDLYKVDFEPHGDAEKKLQETGNYWKNPFIKGVR